MIETSLRFVEPLVSAMAGIAWDSSLNNFVLLSIFGRKLGASKFKLCR